MEQPAWLLDEPEQPLSSHPLHPPRSPAAQPEMQLGRSAEAEDRRRPVDRGLEEERQQLPCDQQVLWMTKAKDDDPGLRRGDLLGALVGDCSNLGPVGRVDRRRDEDASSRVLCDEPLTDRVGRRQYHGWPSGGRQLRPQIGEEVGSGESAPERRPEVSARPHDRLPVGQYAPRVGDNSSMLGSSVSRSCTSRSVFGVTTTG